MKDIYVTRFALSAGIVRYAMDHIDGDMVVVHSPAGMNRCEMFHKPHWYEGVDEAIVRAETMQRKKIASIAKQAERIESINFRGKPVIDMRWDGKVKR